MEEKGFQAFGIRVLQRQEIHCIRDGQYFSWLFKIDEEFWRGAVRDVDHGDLGVHSTMEILEDRQK